MSATLTQRAAYMRSRIAGSYHEDDRYYRVNVTAELRRTEGGSGLTVHHEPRPADALELAITGTVMRGRVCEGGGQIADDLERVTGGPPDGLNADQRAELLAIWKRWHLNGMRGCCAHQDPDVWTCHNLAGHYPNPIPAGMIVTGQPFRVVAADQRYPGDSHTCPRCKRYRWNEPVDACPETGYRAGTAWLHEPLPPDVIERVYSIMGQP